jgi:hypothetical protein
MKMADNDSTTSSHIRGVILTATVLAGVVQHTAHQLQSTQQQLPRKRNRQQYNNSLGSQFGRIGALKRQRVQVKAVYEQLGDYYFRRAYRMTYKSFQKLADKLHDAVVLPISSLHHLKGSLECRS